MKLAPAIHAASLLLILASGSQLPLGQIAAQGSPSATTAHSAGYYDPLKEGSVYRFHLSTRNRRDFPEHGTVVWEVLPVRQLNGRRVTPRRAVLGERTHMQFFIEDAQGVWMYATQRFDQPDPVVSSDPIFNIKNPAQAGTKWTRGSDTTYLIESTDESVTVPAGTFKKCLKVRAYTSVVSGAPRALKKFESIAWYAPEVGQVKAVQRGVQFDGTVQELDMQLEDLSVKSAETAGEIVEKYINARGGLAKLNSIKTLRVTGTATTPEGRELRTTYEFKEPGKVRIEEVSGSTASVRIFDGTRGWSWNSLPVTAPESLTGDKLENLAEVADFNGPLVDYKAKGHRVELLGKESSGEGTFYRLQLTMSNGTVREHLIDAQSFMVAAMRRVLASSSVQDVMYSEWREVDGVKFAYHIDSRFGGRVRKFRVEKYEVNIPIDDDRFAPPQSRL